MNTIDYSQTSPVTNILFIFMVIFFPLHSGIKDIERKHGGRLIKTHLPVHLLPPSVFENGSKVTCCHHCKFI